MANFSSSIKQTAKKASASIAKQIANEGLEVLKETGRQTALLETRRESESLSGSTSNVEEKQNPESGPIDEQVIKQKEVRRLMSLQREAQDIAYYKRVAREQERLRQQQAEDVQKRDKAPKKLEEPRTKRKIGLPIAVIRGQTSTERAKVPTG